MAEALRGKKILVTGPTGQVALPVTMSLAGDNEVWGIARFGDPESKARLEQAGVRCEVLDLTVGDFSSLPRDFDVVINLAVMKTENFDDDMRGNAEATGLLMSHCRDASAFLHCSSTAVYYPKGHEAMLETDPLGDNHRVIMQTYSLCKIAAEAVVRFGAREFGLPTVITRLNVPYGDNGGWPWYHLLMMQHGVPVPVHTDAPSVYCPIHEDDIIAQIPAMLGAASVPATIVNWGGAERVSIEEWCAYLGELTGFDPIVELTDQALESVIVDTSRQEAIAGPCRVSWKDGLRRMVEARAPELLAR